MDAMDSAAVADATDALDSMDAADAQDVVDTTDATETGHDAHAMHSKDAADATDAVTTGTIHSTCWEVPPGEPTASPGVAERLLREPRSGPADEFGSNIGYGRSTVDPESAKVWPRVTGNDHIGGNFGQSWSNWATNVGHCLSKLIESWPTFADCLCETWPRSRLPKLAGFGGITFPDSLLSS